MRRDREKGAAAVEFLLAIPLLILVVFAGLHLGMGVAARGRVADAVGFAARAGAIAARTTGTVDTGSLQQLVTTRMQNAKECTQVQATVSPSGGCPGFLVVSATCTLNSAPFISKLVGNLGLTQVSATAAFPIDCEPQQ